jgi:hypothetical protein
MKTENNLDPNINDVLPSEIIVKILGYVKIDQMGTPLKSSYLGDLYKCGRCSSQKNCIHLGSMEYTSAMKIRLACKYWNTLISLYFKNYIHPRFICRYTPSFYL